MRHFQLQHRGDLLLSFSFSPVGRGLFATVTLLVQSDTIALLAIPLLFLVFIPAVSSTISFTKQRPAITVLTQAITRTVFGSVSLPLVFTKRSAPTTVFAVGSLPLVLTNSTAAAF
jgi:hypothetical protein